MAVFVVATCHFLLRARCPLRCRYSSTAKPVEGRDVIVNDLLPKFRGSRVEPVQLPAEAPLFLMYTSGTTGRAKGCQHSIGGYLAYVTWTSKNIQDIHAEDIYWCMADIGWITGHSYVVYGPLQASSVRTQTRRRASQEI
jgi:acetyl-CoA synthetase